MKAFIIAYNRLTMLKNLAENLTQAGLEVIIIDNASTYPPLLEWYATNPYFIFRMDKNYGHQVLWNQCPELITDQFYIVTDHDLDISHLPSDWVEHLKCGLIENEDVIKCGLSLKIDDLPVNKYTDEVINWEKKYWERPKRWNMWFVSEIDTTLAMYDKTRDFGKLPNDRFFSAVRSDKPYSAIHLPWYNTLENMDDEEKYYSEHTGTYWNEKFKELI